MIKTPGCDQMSDDQDCLSPAFKPQSLVRRPSKLEDPYFLTENHLFHEAESPVEPQPFSPNLSIKNTIFYLSLHILGGKFRGTHKTFVVSIS